MLMKKIFTLAVMLLICAANVSAYEITIDFTQQGYTNGQDITTLSQDGITLTFSKGTNSNGPKYYTTGTAIRLYGSNTLNVAYSGGQITNIAFTFASGEGTNAITADEGTFTSPNWEGNANNITFTIGGTSGHRRIQKMVFTTAASSDTRTETTVELQEGYKTRFTKVVDGDNITLPTATVKAGTATVSGAQVTWTAEKVSGADNLTPTVSGNQVNIPEGAYGRVKITAKYEGNTTYRESEASYTIDIYNGRLNIAEILSDYQNNVLNGSEDWSTGISTSYWQVNGSAQGGNLTPMTATVTYANGANTYIKDENNDCLLFYRSGGIGFEKGDVVRGGTAGNFNAVYGTLKTYNGLLEMEVTENNFEKVSSGATVAPETLDPAKLGDLANMNRYLKVENAEYLSSPSNRNYLFKVGDTQFTVYQQWTSISVEGLEAGMLYTIEGMGSVYRGTPQLYLISFEKTGDATGINTLTTDDANNNAPIYNIAGQKVTADYKGIVVKNGKKYINK